MAVDYDWSDLSRNDEFLFYCCDPKTLSIRSVLSNVILNGSSLRWGYETDTRVSGLIKVINSDYVDHSLIRAVHYISDWNYQKVLATMVVTDDPENRTKGAWTTSYELHSALSMIEKDCIPWPYTIAVGAKASNVIKNLLGDAGRPYTIGSDFSEYTYNGSGPVMYDMGDSRLSDLFDVCNTSGNFINVDGLGHIVMSRYIPLAERSPVYLFDVSDPRTNVIDGISSSSSRLTAPTREIVTYDGQDGNGKDVKIYAYADTKSGETSVSRGYIVAEVNSVSKLEPATQARANELANSYLNSNTGYSKEWTLSILYVPLDIGDIVELRFPDGDDAGLHRCLVKSMKLNFSTITLDLTLKEV